MKRIKEIYRHITIALRYGEWSWGYGWYEDKPKFGFYHVYYDGNHAAFHLGKLWIAVFY
jgi:hypothetical protein